MTNDQDKFRDWSPIRIYPGESSPCVDWCYMGDERFTKPFFVDTIRHRMREPFNLLFRHQTSIDILDHLVENGNVIRPTGFIFHMSRCGSTLVAQMLAATHANIVISEPPPVDSVLAYRHRGVDDEMVAKWLRWIVASFGRVRTNSERRYFIKFDSWNTLDLDLVRKIFRDVPWMFLYRDPLQVIVSHMKQPGSQMVPGALADRIPELTLDSAMQMDKESRCATVLKRICESALSHADDPNGLFVNYDELPGAVTGRIAEHFGVVLEQSELDQMNSVTGFHAKSPQLYFQSDGEQKKAEATDRARDAAETLLMPLHRQLERVREKQRR